MGAMDVGEGWESKASFERHIQIEYSDLVSMVFCGRSDSDTLGIALQSEEPFSPRRKWSDMVTSFELTSSTHSEETCPL